MIDIESEVFDTIADVLRAEFSGIFVAGEQTNSPASFPAVTIVEQDNSVYQKMRTRFPNIENAVQLMYEVNVFSNTVGYKKREAKKILAVIDAEFEKMGFTRTMKEPVDNLQDGSIFRYVARYEAVADKDFWIYTS